MTATTTPATTTKCPNGYEIMNYNNELTLIHSINDDMYNASVMIKQLTEDVHTFKDWLRNDSSKRLIKGFMTSGHFSNEKQLYQFRKDLKPGFQGFYVHKYLINIIASWASPEYAWKIAIILDEYFQKERTAFIDLAYEQSHKLEKQRNQLFEKINIIAEQEQQIEQQRTKINNLQPRVVPNTKATDYKYMLAIDDSFEEEGKIKIDMIRRNKKNWTRPYKNIENSDDCLFVSDFLPISMTVKEIIKEEIRQTFGKSQYQFRQSSIIADAEIVDQIVEIAADVIETFRE